MSDGFCLNRPTLAVAATFALLGVLVGCSDSDDPAPVYNVKSLSGDVKAPGGAGLPGVRVTVGSNSAFTDANGTFVVPSIGLLPSGMVSLEFDGSSALIGGQFPIVDTVIDIPVGENAVSMPRVITLPDLASPESGAQSVNLDAQGATDTAIALTGTGMPDLELVSPAGTFVTIDGEVGAPSVDLTLTPVDDMDISTPLPATVRGGSYAIVGPRGAAFDDGFGLGLGLALPNEWNLPVDTALDIWGLDPATDTWTNRSLATGQQGIVVDTGGNLRIEADGVVTAGGMYAATLPVSTACSTTFEGRVEDTVSSEPIPGAIVTIAGGRSVTTDANGHFSIANVPAYDAAAQLADPQDCQEIDLAYRVFLPPAFGSQATAVQTVPAIDVQAGATTTLADVEFAVAETGILAGLITGDLNPGQQVTLIDEAQAQSTIAVQSSGTFLATGLPVGSYTATYQFSGNAFPSEVPVEIAAQEISTVAFQLIAGQGTESITVMVFADDENPITPLVAADSAQVLLVGTDSGSALGLIAATDSTGRAVFNNVTGPYTITAAKDYVIDENTVRIATSLVEIDPVATTINVPLRVREETEVATDVIVVGTVSNLPDLSGSKYLEVRVIDAQGGAEYSTSTVVNSQTGSYQFEVPLDTDFHMALFHVDSSLKVPTVLASLLRDSISGSSTQTLLTQDFDFSSSEVVAWDNPVSVAVSGAEEFIIPVAGMALQNATVGARFFHEQYTGDGESYVLNLPDLSDAALDGYEFVISVETDFQTQVCERFYSINPTTESIELIGAPITSSPQLKTSYTLAEFKALTVNYTPGAADPAATGFDTARFSSYGSKSAPDGIFGTEWTVWMPAEQSSFALPEAPMPLFGNDQFVNFDLEQSRYLGITVEFDSFFSGDLAQGLFDLATGVSESCSSSESFSIVVTDQQF